MRRLLQLGTLILLLASFLMPIVEFFDRWDAPGPGSDTELPIFGIILTMCLVLLVSALMASLVGMAGFSLIAQPGGSRPSPSEEAPAFSGFVFTRLRPPLRI